jgi:hypothetical protein
VIFLQIIQFFAFGFNYSGLTGRRFIAWIIYPAINLFWARAIARRSTGHWKNYLFSEDNGQSTWRFLMNVLGLEKVWDFLLKHSGWKQLHNNISYLRKWNMYSNKDKSD